MSKYDEKATETNKTGLEEAVSILDFLNKLLEDTIQEKKWNTTINLDKEIDKVVFNNPATIVFWKDGTKTVSKCHNGDTFNKETGLAMCIVRKLTGNRNYNKVFEKYCK